MAAISRPSGDHTWLTTAPGIATGTASPPSIAWMKMRRWFSLSERKDSHFPSGEISASDSALGHVTAGTSARGAASSTGVRVHCHIPNRTAAAAMSSSADCITHRGIAAGGTWSVRNRAGAEHVARTSQRLGDDGRGFGTPVRITFQAGLDDLADRAGRRWRQLFERTHRAGQHLLHVRITGGALERQLSGETAEQQGAERENVRAAVDGSAERLLGRHVLRRTGRIAGQRQSALGQAPRRR